MPKGFFIVIDGPDSVGKSTQTQLLAKRLKKAGRKVTVVDFPRYGEPSAWMVEQHLQGKLGTSEEAGPYIPSILFAVDRYAASAKMKEALKRGEILISNRYVTANMAHQGGKISNSKKRQEYFKWVNELEYGILKLPKPDATLFLHMPPLFSLTLMRGRKDKKKDMYEKSVKHLQDAERTYLEIAKKFKYKVIRSVEGNKLLTPAEVNELVWQTLKSRLKV